MKLFLELILLVLVFVFVCAMFLPAAAQTLSASAGIAGQKQSITEEYPADVLEIMGWVIAALSTALAGLVLAVGQSIQKALVRELTGIRGEIKETRTEIQQTNITLGAIERDIRSEVARLRLQVEKMQVRCDMEHGPIENHGRRKTDSGDDV